MNFDACRRITRENAKSFYFASFPLPREKRDATYATYAFCRTADDVVDDAQPGSEDEARLELGTLRLLLREIESGAVPEHPLWGPFAWAVHRFRMPVATFDSLLDGIESDLTPRRFATFVELRAYCFQVASTVGLSLSHIFGFREDDALSYAANMGIAMQLTNIVRDIGTDYRLGRVYIPQDELLSFGVDEGQIAAGRVDDRFRELLRYQIARSREYYRRAFQGIRYLTRDGSHWTAFLMGDVYRAILDQVEHNDFDVFRRRASLTLAHKVARSALAPINFRRDVLADTAPVISLPEENA
ncbi:MAG TPA: phytoene/squalene synthase family protein [Thermoanaerobaculia bacterium]|nr:phytoene/squalene synthase family protein [Thermoanaerobaculia bacterium]